MPGLWIVNLDETDVDTYDRYKAHSGDAVARHGGRFLARNGRFAQKEGRAYARNVVVEFETYEAALAAYESEEYQSILPDALAGADRQFVIVETDGE